MKVITLLAVMAVLAGCTTYGSEEDECILLSDCNPGKECGTMIRCTDGRCDPTRTFELPCEQDCVSDRDCPEEMHCRHTQGVEGVCVADGTCLELSECLGLPHVDCLGSFECLDGRCQYECLDITICSLHSDCVLADKECCCGFEVDDYLAIRQDKLRDWFQRPECAGIPCPEIDCMPPEDLRAVCENGHCALDTGTVEPACTRDSDCVKVPGDCCGCELGGEESAVHRDAEEQYLLDLKGFCMLADYWCPLYDTCTSRPAICLEGECLVQGEQCNCGDTWSAWDPVCARTEDGTMTLVNECQADCLGLDWFYHGKCECMLQCLVPDPYCASNGVTYVCGQMEVSCNGQIPLYPGECDPACDDCQGGDIPEPQPVCGEDFFEYLNLCYLACRDLDWWHDGYCLDGEGQTCHLPTGAPCPTDDLFCLIPFGCLECPGQCIALGHCLDPQHCIEQPLNHDECEGHWTCPETTCIWQCG